VLKLWTADGGNSQFCEQDLVLGQPPFLEQYIISTLAGDTLYARAWVKSTAIDEPTKEELLERHNQCLPNKDTAEVHYSNNLGSHGGFQVAVQEAYKPGGPPFYVPKAWTPIIDHDGSAIDDWEVITGKMVLRTDANSLYFWIMLRSQSACTVWVDNLQLSSDPEFCGESFDKPGKVPVAKQNITVKQNVNTIRIKNGTVDFGQVLHYTLKIYHTNGQKRINRSGYANKIETESLGLSAGAYIIDIETPAGSIRRPFIIHKK